MAEATTQEALEGLAFDLRWTWMRDADDLWRRIDAERWEQTRNPWLVLQSAGKFPFQRVVVRRPTAPGLVLPRGKRLEGDGRDHLDGRAPRMPPREVGVLGRGK